MSSKPQRTSRYEPDTANETGKTVIRVRRGALRRFDQLTTKGTGLPVDIKWDRRTAERRGPAEAPAAERRGADRRQPPPFTWDAADFVVEGDRSSLNEEPAPKKAQAGKRRR